MMMTWSMTLSEANRRRPNESLTPESPFFATKHNRHPADMQCYFNRPLGKNNICEFLSNASKEYSSTGRKVANQSVRKTSIGRLLDANVPEIYARQHTGHKNVDSLQSYNIVIYILSNLCYMDFRKKTI